MFSLLAAKTASATELVDRLFYQKTGQIVVSAVFGLALAFMFQKVCKGSKCIIIHAPDTEELKKIHMNNEKTAPQTCYKYTPEYVACDTAPAPNEPSPLLNTMKILSVAV